MAFPQHYLAMNVNNPPVHYPVKPVGVFWDIENCPVPKTNNASSVIHFIRSFFVVNRLHHREFDFLVACDVTRLKKNISDDINKAGGVTLAHVSGSSKNAADEKLRESMRKFVDTHGSSTPTLVLISGDIDFVSDLRGYQTRLGCSIIVIHGASSSQHFRTGWNEIYSFDTFLSMMLGSQATSLVAPATNQQGSSKSDNGPKNQYNGQRKPDQGKPNQGGQVQQKPDQGKFQGKPNQGEMKNDYRKRSDNDQIKPGNRGQSRAGTDPRNSSGKPNFNGAQENNVTSGGSCGNENAVSQRKRTPQNPGKKTGNEEFEFLDRQEQPFPKPSRNDQGKPNQGGMRNDFKKKSDNNHFKPGNKGQGSGQCNDSNSKYSFSGAELNNYVAGGKSETGAATNQKMKPMAPVKPPQNHAKKTIDDNFAFSDQLFLGNDTPKPQREPPKENKKEWILMVTGLPGKMDYHILKENLQAKASQVKGSVKFVKNGQGFISFKKKEHADNAIALFNGMEVYGKKLNVHHCHKIPFDNPKPSGENRDGQESEKKEDPLDAFAQSFGAEFGKFVQNNTKNSECCIQ